METNLTTAQIDQLDASTRSLLGGGHARLDVLARVAKTADRKIVKRLTALLSIEPEVLKSYATLVTERVEAT
jgi:hypothetical protein